MILTLKKAGAFLRMDVVGERRTPRMALPTKLRVRKEWEEAQHALLDALPQFVWITRPDGSIAYTNQRWRDYRQLLSRHAGVQEGVAHQPLDDCPQGEDRRHTLPHADRL